MGANLAVFFSGQRLVSPQGSRNIVIVFSFMLLAKAVIAFFIFPQLVHILGANANYHGEMFPDQYDDLALNLANGNGYRLYPDTSPTMLRSPGFVIILAAIFALFGKSLLAVQIVQFGMSAITSVLVYLIARRLLGVPLISLLAAAISLFHPIMLMSDSRGGTDTTLALCLTTCLWLLLRAANSDRLLDFVFLGLAFGYTMLVKASVALIPPLVLVYLLLSPSRLLPRLRLVGYFIISGLIAILVMAPWIVRNYEISGKFVPGMTVGGMAMYQGMEVAKNLAPGKDRAEILQDATAKERIIGREMGLKLHGDFFFQFSNVKDEIAFYRELGRRTWAEYMASPVLLARVIGHNTWAFWFLGKSAESTLFNFLLMGAFLAVSIAGTMYALRRQRQCWILVISWAAFILPHLIIQGTARYATPLVPTMSVMAAALLFAWDDYRASQAHNRLVATQPER